MVIIDQLRGVLRRQRRLLKFGACSSIPVKKKVPSPASGGIARISA
jgi:hypothetical protein